MRASAVVLSACALLVAAGPALGQAPAPPKRGGVFRAPAPDPPTLDPHLNATFSTHVYASLVYSGLVRFPAGPEIRAAGDQRILPDLAEKWEWTSPTTLVFTLRAGACASITSRPSTAARSRPRM